MKVTIPCIHPITPHPIPTPTQPPHQEELRAGEEIARCPSCSLYITVVYNPVSTTAAGFRVWVGSSTTTTPQLMGFTFFLSFFLFSNLRTKPLY